MDSANGASWPPPESPERYPPITYNPPTYNPPANNPTYNPPTYNSPTYNSPTYNSPTYNSPTYNSPTYSLPTYNPPSYSPLSTSSLSRTYSPPSASNPPNPPSPPSTYEVPDSDDSPNSYNPEVTYHPHSRSKTTPTLVAVFGKTGTGKTTFIKSVTGLNLKVGHSLESCTQDVEPFSYKIGEQEILLVDTPGFDDTNLSDADILTRIGAWMKVTYKEGTFLSGIIYLHRITDERMDGASKKNLRMFRMLCGENNLRNVILATTMWDRIDDATGAQRERELIGTYWKDMIENGSSTARISTNPDDAKSLVRTFLNKTPFVARLQEELISGKSLIQTDAGSAIKDEIERITKQYENELKITKMELELAFKRQNINLQNELKAEIEQVNKKMDVLEKEKEKLKKAFRRGRLPRQKRQFLSSKWNCLAGCGATTTEEGRWTCKHCKLTQRNMH